MICFHNNVNCALFLLAVKLFLPAQILLGQHLHASAIENFFGQIIVVEIKGQRAFSIWPRDKGIYVTYVDLGIGNRGEDFYHLGMVIHFHADHLNLAKRKSIQIQMSPGLLGIIHNDPIHRAVAGIKRADGKNVDIQRGEHPDQLVQASHFVLHKDTKLHYCVTL